VFAFLWGRCRFRPFPHTHHTTPQVGPPALEQGMVHVVTSGLHLIVVHLHSSDAEKRIEEARRVVLETRRVPPAAPVVVLGNMNTLSPLDAECVSAAPLLLLPHVQTH